MIKCKKCNRVIVPPYGAGRNGILLVGKHPGEEELQVGIPFVGNAGEVLKGELSKLGVNATNCRMSNLWLHEPAKDCDIDVHIQWLLKEAETAEFILLMGSELAKTFWHGSIQEYYGLSVKPLVKQFFPNASVIYASPNPAEVLHTTVGEFRLSLTKFINEVRKYKSIL